MMWGAIYSEDTVFSDNKAAWKSSRCPEATINNKYVSICFDDINKAFASRLIHVGFMKANDDWLIVWQKWRQEQIKRACVERSWVSS